MKRTIYVSILILISFFLLQSCRKYEVDIAPVEITLSVRNSIGQDLLNPLTDGTLATQGTRLLYQGEYYDLNTTESESISTRYYMPIFYGIKLSKDLSNYVLQIGEFNGHENTEWTEMTIEWGDGTTDTFAYSRSVKGDGGRNLRIKTRFYHNGEQMDSSHIRLVK